MVPSAGTATTWLKIVAARPEEGMYEPGNRRGGEVAPGDLSLTGLPADTALVRFRRP